MNAIEQMNHALEPMEQLDNRYLSQIGTAALAEFVERREALSDAFDDLADIGDELTSKCAERLCRKLETLEPSVTMIGQVKAGKTSLVNAMVGMPDLLPADVNPWTSVVTSLHLSPVGFANSTRASFKFFGDDEWNRLMSRGGRLGELASRAGAEDELEQVRAQLEQMRDKSRQRLGRRFELLLSQQHDYDHFDKELIERYVCLGDDFEDAKNSKPNQGRFADITRSADLYINRPDLPSGFCIRDTPGVNDTFMMREQITIRSIRESRLCVVVLSAHQALSNVDLALIRLISNVKSREIVIFVNRIDELSDPAKQVPEIRESILATLKSHQGPAHAEIIFGSAYWANQALTGNLSRMFKASADALINWAEAMVSTVPSGTAPDIVVWEMSGVPALMRALSARMVEGVGQEALVQAARSGQNLVRSYQAVLGASDPGANGSAELLLTRSELEARVDGVVEASLEKLSSHFEEIESEFGQRLDRAHHNFLDRATAALIGHLDRYGDEHVWQYDPAGLRVLLRTAFQVFSTKAQRRVQTLFDEAATSMAQLYRDGFEGVSDDFRLEPPLVPRIAPPVQIGQTIALDLKGNWWKRWWQRRRGYESYAADFNAMISAETRPVVDDLQQGASQALYEDSGLALREFLTTQRDLILNLADRSLDTANRPEEQDTDTRRQELDAILSKISGFAA